MKRHMTARPFSARAGTKLGVATLIQRLAAHLQGDVTGGVIPDFAITSEPTPADIQRARDLIEEHGWSHLLRPEA